MRIYDALVKPKQDLDNNIDALLQRKKIRYVEMEEIKRLLVSRAEIEARLMSVNATTACDNGRTIVQNLCEQQAWRIASGIAERANHETLAESYRERVEELRSIINDANNKDVV